LVDVLCIEPIAPEDLYVLDIGPLVLASRIIRLQITGKAYLENALTWLEAHPLRSMSYKLPVRLVTITPQVDWLLRTRIEPGRVHVVNLHDSLKGQLHGVVVVGRIVEELHFYAIVLRVSPVVVFEHPAHFYDSVVEVRTVFSVIDPVIYSKLNLAMEAHRAIRLSI